MGTVVDLLLAVAAGSVILKLGLAVLRSLARPLPAPPPEGEMRRVKLTYRCSLCGMELRVQTATSEQPEPPRHCMDEMDLVVPAE